MKKNSPAIILVVVILTIVGFFFISQNSTEESSLTDTVTEESADNNVEITQTVSDPEEVVDVFLTNFILSAPPTADEEALQKAVSFLSEGAKMEIGEEETSGSLALFIGVQDIPDEGYEIRDITYSDNTASGVENSLTEVNVTLKYSGGNTEKTFTLSNVEDSWMIDKIE